MRYELLIKSPGGPDADAVVVDHRTGEAWQSDLPTLAAIDWTAVGHPGIDRMLDREIPDLR